MKQPDAIVILHRARELLADPEHWIQGAYAVDRDSVPQAADGPTAVRWCIVGALRKIGGLPDPEEREDQVVVCQRWLSRHAGNVSISNWQDMPGRQHAELLQVMDAAILEDPVA